MEDCQNVETIFNMKMEQFIVPLEHIQPLELKTILSLTPEPPGEELVEFCQLFGITLVHVPVESATSPRFLINL